MKKKYNLVEFRDVAYFHIKIVLKKSFFYLIHLSSFDIVKKKIHNFRYFSYCYP